MSASIQNIEQLHKGIMEKEEPEILETFLWEAILAYQGKAFYTLSGLEFSYMVKHKKNGDYPDQKLRDAGIPQSPRRDEIQRNQWSSISSSSGISWTKINRADLWNLIYLQHVSGVWPDPYK